MSTLTHRNQQITTDAPVKCFDVWDWFDVFISGAWYLSAYSCDLYMITIISFLSGLIYIMAFCRCLAV
jgi:hypothetical protein